MVDKDYECPQCGMKILGESGLIIWCSSHGKDIPWITTEEHKAGITYETKYPDACGYKLMAG
tara:strand:+ start:4868 stop:5053 length:186 start_codon:yes stop_codon:yes gene_type:complete